MDHVRTNTTPRKQLRTSQKEPTLCNRRNRNPRTKILQQNQQRHTEEKKMTNTQKKENIWWLVLRVLYAIFSLTVILVYMDETIKKGDYITALPALLTLPYLILSFVSFVYEKKVLS